MKQAKDITIGHIIQVWYTLPQDHCETIEMIKADTLKQAKQIADALLKDGVHEVRVRDQWGQWYSIKQEVNI